MIERISRDELLMQVAELIGKRSTCSRALAVGGVGAVIAREGRILSTGYAGAPSRLPHCTDVGCEMGSDEGCVRVSHAELNAIAWAARVGVETGGAYLYCTYSPCPSCAQAIINAGIVAVFYRKLYRIARGVQLLRESAVETTWMRDLICQYCQKETSPATLILMNEKPAHYLCAVKSGDLQEEVPFDAKP